MSQQLSSAIMFIFLVSIAVAANRAEENSAPPPAVNRRPAAAAFGKKAPLDEVHAALFRHTEKIHGPVETQIVPIGAAKAEAGQVFVLKGVISASENLTDVDFKWSIPEGVEVINGALSGRLSQVRAERPAEVELTLKALGDINRQVHLLASGSHGGARFADTAQYNTTLQEEIRSAREALAESTKASARKPAATGRAHSRLKVLH
jgi:hypothetical protein